MKAKILPAVALIVVLTMPTSTRAEEHVRTVNWSELQTEGQLEFASIVQASENAETSVEELHVLHEQDLPQTFRLATFNALGISKFVYRISGRIRYEDLQQPGYLELWSYFPDGSSYFSRTLESSGPMSRLAGSSAGREFVLPFRSSEETGIPERLELNLVLSGQGKVWIGPLQIDQYEAHEWQSAITPNGAWWSPETAGFLSGILGALGGTIGAVVGTLSSRGKGQKFCVGLCWATGISGILSLVAGFVAVLQAQPYAVFYPLLLLGILLPAVMFPAIPVINRRFQDKELRRIEAMDAGAAPVVS